MTRNLHLLFAVLTISGFILRGIWMMRESPLAGHRIIRVVPHIVDTFFLLTGIVLVLQLNIAVLQNHWLLAKFTGLACYIVFGAIALRRGRTLRIRQAAFIAALLAFAYVVGAAMNKSPLSWIA